MIYRAFLCSRVWTERRRVDTVCVCRSSRHQPGTLNPLETMSNPTISTLCIDAVSAFGPMSVNSLVAECVRETGKPSEEVRGAVIEWTERLGVERDEWGGYYLPGSGGML